MGGWSGKNRGAGDFRLSFKALMKDMLALNGVPRTRNN